MYVYTLCTHTHTQTQIYTILQPQDYRESTYAVNEKIHDSNKRKIIES